MLINDADIEIIIPDNAFARDIFTNGTEFSPSGSTSLI